MLQSFTDITPCFTFITRLGFTTQSTRTYVRLLGPCFKTGRLEPFHQHHELVGSINTVTKDNPQTLQAVLKNYPHQDSTLPRQAPICILYENPMIIWKRLNTQSEPQSYLPSLHSNPRSIDADSLELK